ncbi:MAG: hypothetical protein NG747_16220 [Candidatus Brocadia sp.]|nr:hypothetical protein [Candidatus Brocadia sp.]
MSSEECPIAKNRECSPLYVVSMFFDNLVVWVIVLHEVIVIPKIAVMARYSLKFDILFFFSFKDDFPALKKLKDAGRPEVVQHLKKLSPF